MKDQFALRIFDGDELLKVMTTRTGLKLSGIKVINDLSPYEGKNYVLFNITKQNEVASGMIKIVKSPAKDEKKDEA